MNNHRSLGALILDAVTGGAGYVGQIRPVRYSMIDARNVAENARDVASPESDPARDPAPAAAAAGASAVGGDGLGSRAQDVVAPERGSSDVPGRGASLDEGSGTLDGASDSSESRFAQGDGNGAATSGYDGGGYSGDSYAGGRDYAAGYGGSEWGGDGGGYASYDGGGDYGSYDA